MVINLSDIPIRWATIPKNIERHKKMETMFTRLNLTNVTQINGRMTNPYTIGIAETHINCIMGQLPILVLEDDCQETPFYKPIIEVPDDNIDAIYLGTSWYGMISGVTTINGCMAKDYTSDYLRIYNMLSMHAILYLTYDYQQKVIKMLDDFMNNPIGGCDDNIAINMMSSKVLAVKKPFFYQNDGHSEEPTLTPLVPRII